MQFYAYLASETRLYGSQGPLTLIAHAMKNTLMELIKGILFLTHVRRGVYAECSKLYYNILYHQLTLPLWRGNELAPPFLII